MHTSMLFAALAIVGTALAAPFQNESRDTSALLGKTLDIRNTLGRQLSPGASIVLPDNSTWEDASGRWNIYRRPVPNVVVEVASISDIQATVRYARKNNIPFLTKNFGHGSPSTLEKFQGGIQINVGNLNSIQINSKTNVAVMGAGVYTEEVIQALYAAGKQSPTTSCTCVGLLGAGLGGGTGRLQGVHGLIADNILSAKVVLANGDLVVASPTSNPDLYWGLRGAGHNFGIVVEFDYKVHEITPNGTWWWAHYIFSSDMLETLTEAVNEALKTQDPRMSIYMQFAFISANATEPTLFLFLNFAGPEDEGVKFGQQFVDLGPLEVQTNVTSYVLLPDENVTGFSSSLCTPGLRRNQYTIGTKALVPETLRQLFQQFTETPVQHPDLKGFSVILIEIYYDNGVQAIPAESTAYAHRGNNITTLIHAGYSDSSLDSIAADWGLEMRDTLQSTSGYDQVEVYINFAHGNEPLGAIYGYEPWRQQKLKGLKRKYDPDEQFSFYEPIPLH